MWSQPCGFSHTTNSRCLTLVTTLWTWSSILPRCLTTTIRRRSCALCACSSWISRTIRSVLTTCRWSMRSTSWSSFRIDLGSIKTSRRTLKLFSNSLMRTTKSSVPLRSGRSKFPSFSSPGQLCTQRSSGKQRSLTLTRVRTLSWSRLKSTTWEIMLAWTTLNCVWRRLWSVSISVSLQGTSTRVGTTWRCRVLRSNCQWSCRLRMWHLSWRRKQSHHTRRSWWNHGVNDYIIKSIMNSKLCP